MRDGQHAILCIDDDPDFLESTALLLKGAGFLLETAFSAEEGLKRYRSAKPDLVILDLMMEKVDAGLDLVNEIRALGDPPPIYLLSGVGNELHRYVDQSSLGVAGVLQKPIAPDSLLKIIEANLKA